MPKVTVLVVDDSPDIRMLVSQLLRKLGFITVEAEDGYECLDVVQNNRPDLILLDFLMPGMGGLALLSKMKEVGNFKNIPVIMLTGLADATSMKQAIKLGAADYIVKPFSPAVLADKVMAMTISLSVDEIREHLQDCSDPDPTYMELSEFKDYKGVAEVFPFNYKGITLLFVIRLCQPLHSLIKSEDEKLIQSIRIYYRCLSWKKFWPSVEVPWPRSGELGSEKMSEI
ncbi:MAG: hypothetical protein CMP10_10740 [Zetaproteobacteria bacterium]|nr:hypothetical protein [Pseudobdellovibrionaceae bacterium]|tara:strand:- start:1080 stop:1763 length:684 start_codon:yes stop_codon:yes gene_type:complete